MSATHAIDIMKARRYAIVTDASHGLSLMIGHVRLRIDRDRGTAALVGEVAETVDDIAYYSVWTPVPLAVAQQMAQSLHLVQKDYEGDSRGGRAGWEQCGYDGEVADWYCHIQ